MRHYLKMTLIVLLTISMMLCASSCLLTVRTNQDETQTINEGDQDYIAKLEEVVALLDAVYVDGYSTEKLGDLLAEAAVAATGDRWSYYISAEDFAAYVEQTENAYVGIGVTISLVNEDDPGFTIISVTKGSPAEKAGIVVGDMLVAVEGQNVVEIGMKPAQQLVRGEEGTDVTITIVHEGTQKDITVTRGIVETEVVVYELLENGLGYIKINNFDATSADKTIAAIDDLVAREATGLIFDLRFNPGGRKNELVKALDYLLPEGPLFRSVHYTGSEEVDYSEESCLELPMAVLINGDSYSAAEFFAAALQEYDWAEIVGAQTVGKANYQQTFPLSDGSAVAVSTGHYQTPNGVSLEGIGVTPDVPVEVDDETYMKIYYEQLEKEDDPQLQAAISALLQ